VIACKPGAGGDLLAPFDIDANHENDLSFLANFELYLLCVPYSAALSGERYGKNCSLSSTILMLPRRRRRCIIAINDPKNQTFISYLFYGGINILHVQ